MVEQISLCTNKLSAHFLLIISTTALVCFVHFFIWSCGFNCVLVKYCFVHCQVVYFPLMNQNIFFAFSLYFCLHRFVICRLICLPSFSFFFNLLQEFCLFWACISFVLGMGVLVVRQKVSTHTLVCKIKVQLINEEVEEKGLLGAALYGYNH